MTYFLQTYGIRFAATLGLLGLLIGLTGPDTGIVIASGIWFGAALISAQIAGLKNSPQEK